MLPWREYGRKKKRKRIKLLFLVRNVVIWDFLAKMPEPRAAKEENIEMFGEQPTSWFGHMICLRAAVTSALYFESLWQDETTARNIKYWKMFCSHWPVIPQTFWLSQTLWNRLPVAFFCPFDFRHVTARWHLRPFYVFSVQWNPLWCQQHFAEGGKGE